MMRTNMFYWNKRHDEIVRRTEEITCILQQYDILKLVSRLIRIGFKFQNNETNNRGVIVTI